MRIVVGSVIVAALLVPSLARAEEPARTRSNPAHKNPAVAVGLSLGATTAGLILAAVSVRYHAPDVVTAAGLGVFVLGPSAGPLYGGKTLTVGLGLRVAGVALTAASLPAVGRDLQSHDHATAPSATAEYVMLGIGLSAFVVGTISDLVEGPLAVSAHNRRIDELTLAPIVTRGGGGLALSGQF